MVRTAAASKKKQLSEGLARVEELTDVYASHRQQLADKVALLERDLRAAKMRHLAGIKSAVTLVKDAEAELRAALDENKGEFEKPRSRTFFGIKVGWRKLVGSITWTDTTKVVALIKKHFPEQQEVLIKTTETPVADALSQLSGADLKRLGCTVEEDTDVQVLKATDSDIDKVVAALLKEKEPGEKSGR
jgi:hypothetical protein